MATGDPVLKSINEASFDPLTTMKVFDDFLSGKLAAGDGLVGGLGWRLQDATLVSMVESSVNHPGIIRQGTGTTINQDAIWLAPGATGAGEGLLLPGDLWTVSFIVRLVTAGGAITTIAVRVGLQLTPTVDIPTENTDGIAFVFDGGVDTYWTMVTRTGAVATRTPTDVAPVSVSWYNLKLVRTATGVEFYINGVLKGTLATDIPTANALFPHIAVKNLVAGTVRYLDMDYFEGQLAVTR